MEKILGSHTVVTSKFFHIDGVDIDFDNGKQATFEMISFNRKEGEPEGGVIICGYNPTTKSIICIEQFQVAYGKKTYLLPRGGNMIGKTSLEAAQQEFLEETGYEATERIQMPTIFSSPGFFKQVTTVFLALGAFVSTQSAEGDEVEDTTASEISIENAVEMIMDGSIVDARTISGIFMAKEYLEKHNM